MLSASTRELKKVFCARSQLFVQLRRMIILWLCDDSRQFVVWKCAKIIVNTFAHSLEQLIICLTTMKIDGKIFQWKLVIFVSLWIRIFIEPGIVCHRKAFNDFSRIDFSAGDAILPIPARSKERIVRVCACECDCWIIWLEIILQ